MKCLGCGAEIADNTVICPYCGYEVEANAVKEHEDEIIKLKIETENEQTKPDRTAKKVNSGIAKLGIAAAIIIVVAFAIAGIVRTVYKDKSADKQKKQIEILEQYYADKNFSGMYDYLESIDRSYTAVYKKYYEVATIYNRFANRAKPQYEQTITSIKRLEDNERIKELFPEDVAGDLMAIFAELAALDKLREDGYKYDEEEGARALEQDINLYLQNRAGLDEELIKQGVKEYEDKGKESELTEQTNVALEFILNNEEEL